MNWIIFMVWAVGVALLAIMMWPTKRKWNRLYNAYMTIRDKDNGKTTHKWVKVKAYSKREAKKFCRQIGITLDDQ